MVREFPILPGRRESLPLFIGLIGPSSSGKTRSAFELAAGIQSVVGGEIVFINTEGRRGLLDIDLYKKPDGSPAIQHMPFAAPYASLDYLDAINQAQASGAKTIIIDLLSHEHEAEGGMLDYWESEIERLGGDDPGKRQRVQMLAISKPKAARRRLLTRGIMQANTNVIACFRAKETSVPVRTGGKTEIVNMGFTPIAGDEFVYEMALSCLLVPGANGYPTWETERPGEKIAIKPTDPDHELRKMIGARRLSKDLGADLAKWAANAKLANAKPDTSPKPFKPAGSADEYRAVVTDKLALTDFTELGKWWNSAEQKATRADLGNPEFVKEMQSAVLARINELKPK